VALSVPDLPPLIGVTDVEFIEFATSDQQAPQLAAFLETMGFARTGHYSNPLSGCFRAKRRQRRKIQVWFFLGVTELLGPVIRLEVVPDDLFCVRTRHHGSLVVVRAAVTATVLAKSVGPGGRGENPSSGADRSARGGQEGVA